MKPEKQPKIPQEDLFRMRLENMLDINHELIKLSKHIDWESPDKEWGALFVSTKGAPAIRTRLIAGLHYLKHLHDLSDEQVVKGWTENPYWQYFCGEEYFQHKMPIHPTTMTKWRNRPGKSGSEKLLIETIKAWQFKESHGRYYRTGKEHRFSNRFKAPEQSQRKPG